MNLQAMVRTALEVSATSSRNRKVQTLAEWIGQLKPDEAHSVHWIAGELPDGKLGIGPRTLQKLQVPPAETPSLTVKEVDRVHQELGSLHGPGSSAERLRRLQKLLQRATRSEQDFLFRLWLGELRQGALESLLLDALAAATHTSTASVRRAQMVADDLAQVTRAALAEGEAGLARFDLTLFRPIQPMLAQPADSVAEAMAALEAPILERKLDGARIQIHREGREVRVYSRQGNDVTAALPEVVERARTWPFRSVVADGEVLALQNDGRPHPFQTTMRRFGRKANPAELLETLPLSTFVFDVLHADGESLLERPAHERFAIQAETIPSGCSVLRMTPANLQEAERFVRSSFEDGHEGGMLKAGSSTYEAGRRKGQWLKLKQAHTVDLVVLAAEWGSGRRRGLLSNLHLGARSEEGFVMLGKTFKGLTDAMLKEQTRELLEIQTSQEDHVVFVRPERVVEIAYSDVQHSPHYLSGLALRFARVKAFRPDKSPEQATELSHFRAHWDRIRAPTEGEHSEGRVSPGRGLDARPAEP